jgi:hypothetical protein
MIRLFLKNTIHTTTAAEDAEEAENSEAAEYDSNL